MWIVQSEAEPVQFKLENSHPSQKSSLQTGVWLVVRFSPQTALAVCVRTLESAAVVA